MNVIRMKCDEIVRFLGSRSFESNTRWGAPGPAVTEVDRLIDAIVVVVVGGEHQNY